MDLPTPALYILIGPALTGKSTWAASHFEPSEIVSSDALRAVVGAGEDDQTASEAAFGLLDRIVEERLLRGMTTVVDTLGFDARARLKWASWASDAGLDTRHVVFVANRSIAESRNATRPRSLPLSVLRKQFTRFRKVREELGEVYLTVDTGRKEQPATTEETFAQASASPAHHSFGLLISRFNWEGAELGPTLGRIGRRAEEAGFRDLWVMDHFRQIPTVGRHWEDIPEANTTLAYLASITEKIRLGVLVNSVTHRNPVVLGKMLATLDVLSGGRINCGLGIGWDEKEHGAYGIEFPATTERYEMLEETLRVLPLLWGKGSPEFRGKHIEAGELVCYPRPVQDPIPILIGGSGERKTLRLVAQYADAANVFGDPDRVRKKSEVLARHCSDVDRDPADIELTHLLTTMTAETRKELMSRANELRSRNQTSEEFIASNNGATVDQQVSRFGEYHSAGASHSIVTMPDVSIDGSIEGFAPVISAFSRMD